MTEKEVQLLGFEKQLEDDGGWYYYTYDVVRGFSLITNANDEVSEDGEWFVEFYESEPAIRFWNFAEVQALINTLQKHIVK